MSSVYHRLSDSTHPHPHTPVCVSPSVCPGPAPTSTPAPAPAARWSVKPSQLDMIALSEHVVNLPGVGLSETIKQHTSAQTAQGKPPHHDTIMTPRASTASPAPAASHTPTPTPSVSVPAPAPVVVPVAAPTPTLATENTCIATAVVGLMVYVLYLILAARGWPEGLVSISISAVVVLCGALIWKYTAHHDGAPFQGQNRQAINQLSSWYAQVTWFGVGCLFGVPLVGAALGGAWLLMAAALGITGISFSDTTFLILIIVVGYLVLGVFHAQLIHTQATRVRQAQPTSPVGSRSNLMDVVCFSMGVTTSTLFTFFTLLAYNIRPSPTERLFQVSVMTLIGALTLFPLDTICAHVEALRVALRTNIAASWCEKLRVITPHALLRGTALGGALFAGNDYAASSTQSATPLWLFMVVLWAVLVPVCWYARYLQLRWFSLHSPSPSPLARELSCMSVV